MLKLLDRLNVRFYVGYNYIITKTEIKKNIDYYEPRETKYYLTPKGGQFFCSKGAQADDYVNKISYLPLQN